MNTTEFKYTANMSEKHSLSIQKFVRLLYKKNCSDNTVTHYRCHITRLAFFVNKSPNDLTIQDYDDYHNYVVFIKHFQGDYINQLISASYYFFKYIREIPFNIELYSRAKTSHRLHPYVDYSIFKKIWMNVIDKRVKVVMALCYDCGLRANEALHVKIDDIDLTNNHIKICDSKNNKSRYVHIGDIAKPILEKWLPTLNRNKSLFIIPGKSKDRPLYYSNIQALFENAVKATPGIDHSISFHTLRHAYVTMLYKKGVSTDIIQRLLGHSSIITTMNYVVQTPDFMTNLPSHLSHKR